LSKQSGEERTVTFPFGSYDIFSYVIPGATAILGILNFEHWYDRILPGKALTPVLSTLLSPAQSISGDHTVYAVSFAAAVLCVIYVSGHVVSSVSSFFLDRIYVAKAQGYPYETLLLLPRVSGPGFRRPDSKGFYQGIFFWINLYLVLRFATFFFDLSWLRSVLHVVEVILILAATFKLAASIARGMPSSTIYQWLTRPKLRRWLVAPMKFYLAKFFPLPFQIISRGVEGHVRTGRAFESTMRDRYRKSFAEKFGIDPLLAGSDNFWLCKMFVADRSPGFNRNLTYWLDMYTYARNLSTACYIAFLYCFCFVYLQYPRHFIVDKDNLFILVSVPLGYFLMAGILAVRFRYIYVGYYNRFLYRSFIFLCGVHEDEIACESTAPNPSAAADA
jgi:hypothetical protein